MADPSPTPEWLIVAKDAAATLGPLVTMAATVIGGVWAWRRFGWRLKVDAAVECRRVSRDMTLVAVVVTIENAGARQVTITDGWVEVLQVKPVAGDPAERLARGAPGIPDGRRRALWPSLGEIKIGAGLAGTERTEVSLKDSERDSVTFEFLIPAHVETVRVWGHLKDPVHRFGYMLERYADVPAPASSAPACDSTA